MSVRLVTVRTGFDFVLEKLGHSNELNGPITCNYTSVTVNEQDITSHLPRVKF